MQRYGSSFLSFISEPFKIKRPGLTELQQPSELSLWLIQNYWEVCPFSQHRASFSSQSCLYINEIVFQLPQQSLGGFRCRSSPPEGRLHADQKSPKGTGTPPGSCASPLRADSPSVAAGLDKSPALQGSGGPQWSLTVPVWADQGLLSGSGFICLFVCYLRRPLNVTSHKQSGEQRSKSRSHMQHAGVLNQ